MSLNHFGLRIKCNCHRIYEELVRKEFSFKFSRNCVTRSKRDQVFYAAEHDLFAVGHELKTLLGVVLPSASE